MSLSPADEFVERTDDCAEKDFVSIEEFEAGDLQGGGEDVATYAETEEKWLALHGSDRARIQQSNAMYRPNTVEGRMIAALIMHQPKSRQVIAKLDRVEPHEKARLLADSDQKCQTLLKGKENIEIRGNFEYNGERLRASDYFTVERTRYFAIFTCLEDSEMWKAVARQRGSAHPLYTTSHRCNLANPNRCVERNHVRFGRGGETAYCALPIIEATGNASSMSGAWGTW